MPVQPYLFFEGRCEEAVEFYKQALGAKVEMLMRYKEAPPTENASPDCGGGMPDPEKIMHLAFTVDGNTILASDGRCSGQPKFEGVALSLTVPDVATCRKRFEALSAGGQIGMPIGETFFSPMFGMAIDKFGLTWMVLVDPQKK
jgi:PhnB protein